MVVTKDEFGGPWIWGGGLTPKNRDFEGHKTTNF